MASTRERNSNLGPRRVGVRPVIWAMVAMAAVTIFVVAYVRLWGFLQDDSFISLRYAQHLAEGKGLVYNAGERVEGYTNFLWTTFLVVPFLFHWALVPYLKIASASFGILAAYATWRLARATLLAPDLCKDRWVAALPALLFLLSPAVVISAAEGLETMMFTFLLVFTTALFFEETRPSVFPRSAIAASALAMTRPDGVVFGVWSWCVGLTSRRSRRYLVGYAIAFLVMFGVYFIARATYYGDLLPNTFYAKRGGSVALLGRGWVQLMRFVTDNGGWVWVVALATFLSSRTRGLAIALGGIVALRLTFHLWSGGPWMERHRFLIPILPFLHVLTMGGIATWRTPTLRRVAAGFACLAMLLPAWLAYPGEEMRARGYGYALRRAHGALGTEINARTAPSAVLAMDDAGLAPFLADRTTIDMLGLNDRHIAHLPGAFGKFDIDYVLGRRPDLIVLISYVPEPVHDADFRIAYHARIFRSPTFRADYRFTRRFEFGPDYYLLAYRRVDSAAVPVGF